MLRIKLQTADQIDSCQFLEYLSSKIGLSFELESLDSHDFRM